MKRFGALIGSLITIILLVNWATPESSKDKFYGEVTTQQNNVIKLNNMRIGRDRNTATIKDVPVYEKPKEHAQPIPITGTENQEIVLNVDPSTQLYKKEINLHFHRDFTIPHPDIIWTYKAEKEYRKREYIEVVVNKKEGDEHFLIERRMKLFGDSGLEVPFPAIKKLHIECIKPEATSEVTTPPCLPNQQNKTTNVP